MKHILPIFDTVEMIEYASHILHMLRLLGKLKKKIEIVFIMRMT